MASSAGASILIVEDEAELRNLFALILEMEGFTVLQAADGQKGLDILSTHAGSIRMVITDLNLPKVGGMDLINQARKLNPAVKIVGTSGMSGDKVREMVMRAGADDFIPKPFQAQDAIRKLKAILDQP
ncbi:MAG: response regulator [Ignavibacteriae bacterium]|nr:response regulator [Ignavibacteriota bacterium]